jgi:hypothetical protein
MSKDGRYNAVAWMPKSVYVQGWTVQRDGMDAMPPPLIR